MSTPLSFQSIKGLSKITEGFISSSQIATLLYLEGSRFDFIYEGCFLDKNFSMIFLNSSIQVLRS
jgi:hypothetical protein